MYNVDDHHWGLLYDALGFATAVANERDAPGRLLPLGPIRVGVTKCSGHPSIYSEHPRPSGRAIRGRSGNPSRRGMVAAP